MSVFKASVFKASVFKVSSITPPQPDYYPSGGIDFREYELFKKRRLIKMQNDAIIVSLFC
jgi:hypothetical protein